ncbi:MAG: amidase [Janthinobacterium lividum]
MSDHPRPALTDDALPFLTLAEASAAVQSGALSPVRLAQAYLARIAAFDGQLHSFIRVLREPALQAAQDAERDIAAGRSKGPLHGLPIALKDIYNTAGVATTAHSALFLDHIPDEDATTVRLLREAGAVLIGKTATWEFAVGGVSFDLPFPPARNPWNTAYDPAGSSSGSGVAVAAGFCAAALGTDTGGSIRSPSAWNGVAGLKPTYGLVSRHGVLPLSFTLDHAGPMAWTVEDCAMLLNVLAAHDPADPASARQPSRDYVAALRAPDALDLSGLRIGVVRHFFESDSPAEPDVRAATEAALAIFRAQGAQVRDVTMAPLRQYHDLCNLISAAESYAIHAQWLRRTPEKYGAIARDRIASGAFVAASDYVNALRHRARLCADAARLMHDVDLLVCPTRPMAAQRLGELDVILGTMTYTRPFNVLGLPALSVCSGFSADGLPLSLQIAGRAFEDARVLKAGHAFERIAGHRARRPVLQS